MNTVSLLSWPEPLDEFTPEATASLVDRIAPPPVPDPHNVNITLPANFSFRKFSWLVPTLATLFAGYSGLVRLYEAQSAPQQAADAATMVMIAVVAYLFARSVDELVK